MARVLLIEDDAALRSFLEHVLFDAHYQVDSAATVARALELIRCRSYDIVLADAKMPDGTGIDVADIVRERGGKVLVITGYAFTLPRSVRQQYEILLKPVRPDEIVAAIERALAAPDE